MLTGKNKELQKIINLINGGKFSVASVKLTEFFKKNHKPEINIRAQLTKALLTTVMGSWGKGLEILDAAISESKTLGIPLLLIDAFIAKTYCLLFGEQFKKAILLIEETEKKLTEKLKPEDGGYKIRKTRLLLIKGKCYMWMGDLKHAREAANESLPLVKSLNDIEVLLIYTGLLGDNEFHSDLFEKAIVHYLAGLQLAIDAKNELKKYFFSARLLESHRTIGRFNFAIKYCDLAIESVKKLGWNPNWMLYHKAFVYIYSGELEQSVLLLKEVLPSFENETTLKERAFALAGKAVIKWVEGDLDKAIEYLTEGIDLIKKRDDAHRTNLFSNFLAKVLFDKGEFDKVLEICFSILDTCKGKKRPYSDSSVFYLMGKTYHMKGEYNLALEYLQKALKLFKRFNDFLFISQSLFTLLQISIDKNDKELTTKYLEEFEAFVKDHPTDFFEQMNLTAQALVLKNSSRPRDWAKAAEILIDVVNNKFKKHDFTVIVLINLCELLMNEFSISGDDQILQELEFYIEKLSEIAKMQNVHHLRLEANNMQILTHWLKAQKSLVEFDFQKAKILLEDTRNIADETGLYRLAEKLTQQQAKLLGQLSEWDDFIRKYYEFIRE